MRTGAEAVAPRDVEGAVITPGSASGSGMKASLSEIRVQARRSPSALRATAEPVPGLDRDVDHEGTNQIAHKEHGHREQMANTAIATTSVALDDNGEAQSAATTRTSPTTRQNQIRRRTASSATGWPFSAASPSSHAHVVASRPSSRSHNQSAWARVPVRTPDC
jgi:hypothetical protein